ncbi:hypothetical protein SAMN05421690_10054 [Nitrosomonas sp. Nm51]|nr:hypothetical protein [Nitrosomonas sp. Nm51]SEQ98314.1 hypothetical protein SAMN05421690_10054 [Nitrosomonas sp. Nm51]
MAVFIKGKGVHAFYTIQPEISGMKKMHNALEATGLSRWPVRLHF